MATVTVDVANSRLVVEAPDSRVTVQELVDAVRDRGDAASILVVSSDQDLGGGVHVYPTAALQGSWRVAFAAPAEPPPDVVGGFLTAPGDVFPVVDPTTGNPVTDAHVDRQNDNAFSRPRGRVFF